MDRELMILNTIEDNETISQRKLAKLTECSLGTINAIMQKFVKDELIICEDIHSKVVKYILTAEGKEYKAHKTYLETISCYNTISRMKSSVKEVILNMYDHGFRVFYLAGDKNEIYKLLKMTLIEMRRELEIHYLDYGIEIALNETTDCILYWDAFEPINNYITCRNIFIN